jgi:DNA invertase Pin-like site-specific DNA recombinase
VFTDAAVSGSSLDGRVGLQAVLTAAAANPREFDVLLVDDSSRVARDLADALRILQRLRFAGVRVIYISQGIDSASEQAETLIAGPRSRRRFVPQGNVCESEAWPAWSNCARISDW